MGDLGNAARLHAARLLHAFANRAVPLLLGLGLQTVRLLRNLRHDGLRLLDAVDHYGARFRWSHRRPYVVARAAALIAIPSMAVLLVLALR